MTGPAESRGADRTMEHPADRTTADSTDRTVPDPADPADPIMTSSAGRAFEGMDGPAHRRFRSRRRRSSSPRRRRSPVLRLWQTGGALALALLLTGHVGTDDVFFAGEAGPWHVRVSIRQPGVIPGLADISVRVAEPGVERVTVTARRTLEGSGEAPPPDVAGPVPGESDLWAARLWLMVRGSHEVVVTVDGQAGEGVARVPIVAAATKQLAMERGLGVFIIAGGLFLVFGLITIVGAASRESTLPAEEQPASGDRARALRAMAVATVLLALVLFGGMTWVKAESEAHRARLDRPWASTAAILERDGARILEFEITEPFWVNRDDADWLASNGRYRRADMIPDHGKMMHMFVVRSDAQTAFAHIHPERIDTNRFEVPFPPLPPGTYRVYVDVTHEDGFAHTMVATVVAGPVLVNAGSALPDPDDAWWIAGGDGRPMLSGSGASPADSAVAPDAAEATGPRATSPLPDRSVMRWLDADQPLIAGSDADLSFRVEEADGSVVALDPYMGMGGHAMLNRSDGNVFVHLHPTGMISMAAQSRLNAPATGMSGMAGGMDMANRVEAMSEREGVIRFPLVLPQAGAYRIWVQVRRGDRVLTGSFDATIVDAET